MPKKNKWKSNADKREHGSFSTWPHVCATHENFYCLSSTAKALLFELLGQYRGKNNGDMDCAWENMRHKGWNSRSTIERARNELLERGWIVLTRRGGRNQCHLYGLTFLALDECNGKLDARSFDGKSLGYWKLGHNPEQ